MTTKTTWAVARVLRDRDAGLYLSGVVVSGFGTSALWLASGVWVKDLTGSDGLAALCVLAMWLPTLAGPLLGTLADRGRRRPLLIGVNVLLGALLLTLVGVDAPGDLWLLYAVLFVYGAAGVVHDAAESALVATAVDPSLLGDFNGLRMTATEGMKLLAPLAGAGLYAAHGGAGVALLDAATFVLAAGLYALLRVREEKPAQPTGSRRRRTAEECGTCGRTPCCAPGPGGRRHDAVRRPERGDGVRRRRRPRALPAYTGVLYAVQGAGSVAVGLLCGPALRHLGARRFAASGIVLLALAVALRAVPSDPVALVCGAAIGMGLPAVLIATLTSVQRETPGALLGRVTATAHTLVFTPNVAGLAAGAALVELVDHRLVLVALGVALLVTAAPLCQRAARAERTVSRSSSDASPA